MVCRVNRETEWSHKQKSSSLFAGYNSFREVCGLGRVKSFDLLADLIPVKIVERLKLLYAHVDDIDLFVGGISETAEAESLLGEIILKILNWINFIFENKYKLPVYAKFLL